MILETIKQRRSIHQFKEEVIDLEILKDIFTYASYAPTHYMKEPWNIKLYQGEGKEFFVNEIIKSYQRIGMIKKDNHPKTVKMIESMKTFLVRIPHHALIYFKKEDNPIRYEEEYASVCAFIQNAQLAAWEYGIGMLWTITPYMHDPGFIQAIDLDPSSDKIAAVMQIGYPLRVLPVKKRTPIEHKLEVIDDFKSERAQNVD